MKNKKQSTDTNMQEANANTQSQELSSIYQPMERGITIVNVYSPNFAPSPSLPLNSASRLSAFSLFTPTIAVPSVLAPATSPCNPSTAPQINKRISSSY